MKVVGVIPARYASTRFEGKVLAPIAGKPMIEHVWERASRSQLLDELIVACDDIRVYDVVKAFGAQTTMTPPELASGSDRIAHVIANIDADIVVNIQGDEPLIHPSLIDDLANALLQDKKCSMATVIKRIERLEDVNNPNIVKVVINSQHYALYFSRSPIPFNRDNKSFEEMKYYKHLGIYAYTKDFLLDFKAWPNSLLENSEQLEQLRVLEEGYQIKTVITAVDTVGVDTKEDLAVVEKILKRK